eukprot:g1760.t1
MEDIFCFTQVKADQFFGLIVLITGSVGTPVGGSLLDWYCSTFGENRLSSAMWQISLEALIGCVLCTIAVTLDHSLGFILALSGGCLLIFATTSGTNLACMMSVKHSQRSLAVALCVVLMHALGDVPSPPVIGLLIDDIGVRDAIFFVAIWLSFVAFLWGIGYFLAKRRKKF